MEIPPISEQEVEQEWAKLKSLDPAVERFIAENMLIIQKCFGDRAYADALASIRSPRLPTVLV